MVMKQRPISGKDNLHGIRYQKCEQRYDEPPVTISMRLLAL